MAFHLKRKETVEAAVQRIAGERIACALEALEARDRTTGIHEVRKEIKKLRALLRLVRPGLGRKVYGRETQTLRQAANLLAGVRDAHVTLKAFSDLNAHFRAQLHGQSFTEAKRILERRCRAAAAQYEQQAAARSVAKALRDTRRGLRKVRLRANGWGSICPGVNWSYRRGRSGEACAVEATSAENLHAWRKRVKDLWYQTLLLRQVRPRQMCALAKELKELSDLLGDDHDLGLLKTVLAESHVDGREGEALGKLIAQRQEELRAAALVRGARFYAEKPAEFCTRLGRYWKVWCAGKGKLKHVARASVQE
jgi:CHAD domain-containing protein